ncbi:MAG TPA: DUF2490 domain-containing protein [Gemmatimonadaceae bacterium]|nr:DUF2490 domain-containing protein [Gemmatimonadaceae bacterium]
MRARSPLPLALLCLAAWPAGAQTPATGNAIWPEADYSLQLTSNVRVDARGQLKDGTDYAYQQWSVGGEFFYQWQRILARHAENVDRNKEHHVVLGAGYEYLQTDQPTPAKFEHRLVLDLGLNFRPAERLLLNDRNQYEYRWVDGNYSTRYRNRLELDYDVRPHPRPVRPYVAAEFFYDVTAASWNEEQYTAGIEWPLARTMTLATYYLLQECTSCAPAHQNVLGITWSAYGVLR